MKLSVVVICWNNADVIEECLRSIFAETQQIEFEVIVADNGSIDGSREMIREKFPRVQLIENKENLGFARGNNAGIAVSRGEYVLILNPDTIILDRALDRWISWADQHPEVAAFGCRVLNPDGSLQHAARPMPTVSRYLVSALWLSWLGRFWSVFTADHYVGWQGLTVRQIDYQSGCCLLVRGKLLRSLGGFDDRFFYHFEETDLCLRLQKAGFPILFYPDSEITHLGGQSIGTLPLSCALETYRNRYRFFHKHYGWRGAKRIRRVTLLGLGLRVLALGLARQVISKAKYEIRWEAYRTLYSWNREVDLERFLRDGDEPWVGVEPVQPASAATRASAERSAARA